MITIFLLLFLLSTQQTFAEEILQDTQFANGFGACWWAGKDYVSGGVNALCSSYKPITGYTVNLIPSTDPNKSVQENNANKYWEFNEGVHKNYTDETGKLIDELYPNYLTINREIIKNDDSGLIVQQFNPKSNELIKQVTTDKHGKISLYYNTKNEIRNVANKYNSEFANDTWPHFQLSQNLRQLVDLGKYEKIITSVDIKINKWDIVPNWPFSGLAGYSPAGMQLSFGTFIRSKANPYEGIFVGVRPYNDTQTYSEYQNIDQWGQGFYDDDVRLYGGPAKLGQITHIEFDFIAMVDKALKNTGKTHKDYYLSMIGLGYEGMGWFDGEFEASNLSMLGTAIPTTTINQKPAGIFDGVNNFNCSISGWAYDPSETNVSIPIQIYADGPPATGKLLSGYTANVSRPDVNQSQGITGNHGFNVVFDKNKTNESFLFDGLPHPIYAFGIDTQSPTNNNTRLSNSPQTITCPKGDELGDATIKSNRISLSTKGAFGGGIVSLKFDDFNYMNDTVDREVGIQTAWQNNNSGECFNPTHQGSRHDGNSSTTTSKLIDFNKTTTSINLSVNPAYWLQPGENSDFCNWSDLNKTSNGLAQNTVNVSIVFSTNNTH